MTDYTTRTMRNMIGGQTPDCDWCHKKPAKMYDKKSGINVCSLSCGMKYAKYYA